MSKRGRLSDGKAALDFTDQLVPRLFFADDIASEDVFPDFIEVQRASYDAFMGDNGSLKRIFTSIFPVEDPAGRAVLEFVDCTISPPKYDAFECMQRGTSYSAALRTVLRLIVRDFEGLSTDSQKGREKPIKDVKEQEVYIGDIPVMTDNGTFIINGIERVVVSQMHRSPGVFFSHDEGKTYSSGKLVYFARVIPYRGSWLDFEFDSRDMIYFRIDRKRKLPVSILLRCMGMSNEDVLGYFYESIEYVRCDKGWIVPFDPEAMKGARLSSDLIDADTGKIVLESGSRLSLSMARRFYEGGLRRYITSFESIYSHVVAQDVVESSTGSIIAKVGQELAPEILQRMDLLGIKSLSVLKFDSLSGGSYVWSTLYANPELSIEDALIDLYRVIRPGEIATVEVAENLFHSTFFDETRYDLSEVGRVKLNATLGIDCQRSVSVLTKDDILAIIKRLTMLKEGCGKIDDIDHLSNRRVRSVGEFIENQFRVGLVRMERVILEYMSMVDLDGVMPCDLINSKILIAVIKEFFASSQLSQFMDQTNPLSELTHKRRLSALGPGGLTRERAGFEVRDVHPSHYGRICPIETPEGQNIGLINSLALYAMIDRYGFIQTPYYKVIDGLVTDELIYLSAIEEGSYNIAQAGVAVDQHGVLQDELLYCRRGDDFVMVVAKDVNFIDVSPKQVVSVAASLIPFLENDDANRALMGSNMQRQAVPLLRPSAPLIGTGMEKVISGARGSGAVLKSSRAGVVDYVDANSIVIRSTDVDGDPWIDTYVLRKFQKSNHSTCIHQRPIVSCGDEVIEGQVIADGPASDRGDLALGQNLVVAFVSWNGYNFEDSMIVSNKVIQDDLFTSIHIEGFECVCRDTRLGPEEITRDISVVGEEFLCHLDEYGIVNIGAEVEASDVLVGKVTPKGESLVSAEEKLLRAIFGEKAVDVSDASLYLPPGIQGTVMDVRIFLRRGLEKSGRALLIEKQKMMRLNEIYSREVAAISSHVRGLLRSMLLGATVKTVPAGLSLSAKPGDVISPALLDSLPFDSWWGIDVGKPAQVDRLKASLNDRIVLAKHNLDLEVERLFSSDDLPQGVLCVVKVFVAIKHSLQPGDKMSGRHGNKGVISKIVPVEDMPYLEDGTPVDMILNPLGVPSRMNVGQILETHIGWISFKLGAKIKSFAQAEDFVSLRAILAKLYRVASFDDMSNEAVLRFASKLFAGVPVAAPVFEGPKEEEINSLLELAGLHPSGQEVLYDGVTGERFEKRVTVGVMYVLKLHHLVDDKIHARSIGAYSLITQQPLGGKAHFGGQRCGEMESWGLQAYGAVHILLEMLTIKSDDVVGRVRVYEAIIRGDYSIEYGTPESFNVMVNELRALMLNVELLGSDGDEDEAEESSSDSTISSISSL